MSSDWAAREASVRRGAYLPHWTALGGTYDVVFRLADSLPALVVAQWQRERSELLASESQLDPTALARRRHELFAERIERHLDQGQGACWLRQPAVARVVANALHFRASETHELVAWCVMPNHVHVVIRPLGSATLPVLMKSWKGFTAREANRALGRQGGFWQPEYYDHLVRDETELLRIVRYVWENPAVAKLDGWEWRGLGAAIRERLSARGEKWHGLSSP